MKIAPFFRVIHLLPFSSIDGTHPTRTAKGFLCATLYSAGSLDLALFEAEENDGENFTESTDGAAVACSAGKFRRNSGS